MFAIKTRILLLPIILILFQTFCLAQKQRVIIDADTGNEIDDVPAVSYALMTDNIDIIGLTAEQWNRYEVCGQNTMLESWELNNRILKSLKKDHIPSLKGAEIMVGKQWSMEPPRKSDASDFIVKNARESKKDEKLIIICTGAVTNVASAIMIDSTIVDKIAVYFIGTTYNFERKAISKNEFNVRNDLNAFDLLLNTKNLELHIMPANVCTSLVFYREEVLDRLSESTAVESLFLERWNKIGKEAPQWIMWDIGIVEAIIHPQLVKEIKHRTPPENVPRDIFLATEINAKKMIENFWKVYKG